MTIIEDSISQPGPPKSFIDWEYKFGKQLEINKYLVKKNIELLRKNREGFSKKPRWTQDYPTVNGWYWVKATFDGHPRLDHYWEASDESGVLTCTDSDFDEYGPEHHKGYWFSDQPIQEPE